MADDERARARGEGFAYYWAAQFPNDLFVRMPGDGGLWQVPYKNGGWHERKRFSVHGADLRPMEPPKKVNLFAEQVSA